MQSLPSAWLMARSEITSVGPSDSCTPLLSPWFSNAGGHSSHTPPHTPTHTPPSLFLHLFNLPWHFPSVRLFISPAYITAVHHSLPFLCCRARWQQPHGVMNDLWNSSWMRSVLLFMVKQHRAFVQIGWLFIEMSGPPRFSVGCLCTELDAESLDSEVLRVHSAFPKNFQ